VRDSEGAPSCRAPHGHDQSVGEIQFFCFLTWLQVGDRKSTKRPLATVLLCLLKSHKCLLAAATSRKLGKKSSEKTNPPKFGRDHVVRGGEGALLSR